MKWIACALVVSAAVSSVLVAADAKKTVIGHRGASGYAPEHTLASYKMAIQMKTDFVEPDLGVTKDGVLICLHDDTLERTTNIAEVFPERPSANVQTRAPGKHWLANDFTLAEIKQLDAGKWYKPEFAGQKVVSFQEMIDLVRGSGSGIYPELKSPPLYKSRGLDMEQIFVGVVKKNGLEKAESLKTFPVIIQSFDEESIRRVAVDLPTLP
ncbi:MAG TPA: glycerophosphodiester phosphodiesterase family protein, partial [Vicinamibacterales bacterium]|nr:glycerophosphodiester phosphodiesterase family protein [Vicinamibacterales bacterium]